MGDGAILVRCDNSRVAVLRFSCHEREAVRVARACNYCYSVPPHGTGSVPFPFTPNVCHEHSQKTPNIQLDWFSNCLWAGHGYQPVVSGSRADVRLLLISVLGTS